MKEKFGYFGPATLLYAVIYAFCTFKNPSGITYPLFIAVSLIYLGLSLAKLGMVIKKNSLFYMVSIMLLGVSTFCTDDWRIIMMNKTGIFVLAVTLLLQQFCETNEWSLEQYLKNMLRLVFGSLGEIGSPVSDGAAYCKEKNKILNKKAAAVLIGVVAAVPLLIVVLLLLGSADAVFGIMVESIIDGIQMGENFGDVVNILIRIFGFGAVTYACLTYLSGGKLLKEEKESVKGEPIIAITVTGMLTAVYLLFCGIQVVYLFFGKMTLPAGYTYAGYAREGFFQLLAVSVLNLFIVLIGMGCFRESKILKIILTIMSFCTFILIISSGLRMIMYIRYYFLTFLRVFVLWSLLVLFLLFMGVLITVWKEKMPLFRYCLMVVTVCYLLLSFSRPDYYIAKINLANAPYTGMEDWKPEAGDFFQSGSPYRDYQYLKSMSADAAPALIPFMAKEGVPIEVFYEEDVFENFPSEAPFGSVQEYHYYLMYLDNMKYQVKDNGWRQFNISRHMMLKCIEKYSEMK